MTERQFRQFPWILYELFSIIIHDLFILISVKSCCTAHHFSSTPNSCHNHSKPIPASSSCNNHQHWFKLHLVLLHINHHCQQLHLGTSLNSRLFIGLTLGQDMSMIMPIKLQSVPIQLLSVSIQHHIYLWQIHYKQHLIGRQLEMCLSLSSLLHCWWLLEIFHCLLQFQNLCVLMSQHHPRKRRCSISQFPSHIWTGQKWNHFCLRVKLKKSCHLLKVNWQMFQFKNRRKQWRAQPFPPLVLFWIHL